MHLTRASEYALLGLARLAALPPGNHASAADIAAGGGLPADFLAKIFRKLARRGILNAARGPGRGFALARPATELRVMAILEAIEGANLADRCLLWQGHCADANPCPLHFRLKEMHPTIRDALGRVTLADYVELSKHYTVRGAPAADPAPVRLDGPSRV